MKKNKGKKTTEWDPECHVVTWLIQPQVSDRRSVSLVVVCPPTDNGVRNSFGIYQTCSYTGTNCNLNRHPNAQRHSPGLSDNKYPLVYEVHKGKRVRLSLLPVLGLFSE